MKLQMLLSIVLTTLSLSMAVAQFPIPAPTLIDIAAVNARVQKLKSGDVSDPGENLILNRRPPLDKAKGLAMGGNKMFDIYALPLDNMLCLVPNKAYAPSNVIMEAFVKKDGLETNDKMPNLFKGQVLNKPVR